MTDPDDASAVPAAPAPAAAALPPGHGLVFYLFQLLPPLLLVWVMATDRGRFLDLHLGVLLMFALYSVVSLLWRLGRGKDPARLLRPAIVLVVFAGAAGWHRHENVAIRAHLQAKAEEMQAACDAAGRCVAAPWDFRANNSLSQEVGAPGSRVRWEVVCRADDHSFLLEMPLDDQWTDTWVGGVATPVSAATWVDWKKHSEDPRPTCTLP